MKKQMGIDMTQIIITEDDSDITYQQLGNFVDEFLKLVDRYGWMAGGGFTLVDVNSDEDDDLRLMMVVLGQAHEALEKGETEVAKEIIGQNLSRLLRGHGDSMYLPRATSEPRYPDNPRELWRE